MSTGDLAEFSPQAMNASSEKVIGKGIHSRDENTIVFSDAEMLEYLGYIEIFLIAVNYKSFQLFPKWK